MSVVYVLLPLALVGALAWAVTFIRMVHGGQLEDLDGAAWRVLGDDDQMRKNCATDSASAQILHPDSTTDVILSRNY